MATALDLTGMQFGRLSVQYQTQSRIAKDGRPRRQWLCTCDCGNTVIVSTQNLRKGDVKSCGCLKREKLVQKLTTHGESKTKLHNIWKAMRKRCMNTHNSDFKYYGGRAISVCKEWNSNYDAFRNWALDHGYRDGLTIDRIDVNGDYSPENCRFCSMKEQANNRTNNVIVKFNGVSHTIKEWSEITGIPYQRLYMRLRNGWDAERAIRTI